MTPFIELIGRAKAAPGPTFRLNAILALTQKPDSESAAAELAAPAPDDRVFCALETFTLLLAALVDRNSPHYRAFDRRVTKGLDGRAVDTVTFPAVWLRRLDRAAEAGLFERRTAAEIAGRILTTEPPADLIEGDNRDEKTD